MRLRIKILVLASLFPTVGSYGYSGSAYGHSYNANGNLCTDLIGIFKAFNRNMGWAVAALTSGSKDSTECHNFIVACIHELTGKKPRLDKCSNGNLAFWRE